MYVRCVVNESRVKGGKYEAHAEEKKKAVRWKFDNAAVVAGIDLREKHSEHDIQKGREGRTKSVLRTKTKQCKTRSQSLGERRSVYRSQTPSPGQRLFGSSTHRKS